MQDKPQTDAPQDPPTQLTFKSLAEMREAIVKHHRGGNSKVAKQLYRAYLANKPDDSVMWSNLGALFRAEKNYALAALCQHRALNLKQHSPSLLNNASNAIFDAGDAETALDLRRQALKAEPNSADHWSTLAKYLRALGRHEEARTEMEKAFRVFPDDIECHIQHAFALLSLGDYPNGFEAFEWRWQGDEISLPEFEFPRWSGEDLAGKTLLVTPEQGFGDTILMARFLKPVQDLGARVILSVKPPLRRVFDGIPGIDGYAVVNNDIRDCDYWTPMMDLPRYLRTTIDTLPPPIELTIPEDSKDRARNIVKPHRDAFKIGVLWSGSVTYRANHKRSFSHQQFLQLADIPGVQMFSLYKGPLTDAFHEDGTSCLILDAASNDRDFADSAALIRELDLVITMDSAIAHVSGSLGAKVWNLLHSEAYWLYEPFPDHTPWYPSMRLIRQEKSGDWDTVFAQIKDEVTQLAKAR